MQKKFAQKLNEHNEQSRELLSAIEELMDISKNQTKNGNIELAERIANLVERCTNTVGKIAEVFEEEHEEELELLQQVLADGRNSPIKKA